MDVALADKHGGQFLPARRHGCWKGPHELDGNVAELGGAHGGWGEGRRPRYHSKKRSVLRLRPRMESGNKRLAARIRNRLRATLVLVYDGANSDDQRNHNLLPTA